MAKTEKMNGEIERHNHIVIAEDDPNIRRLIVFVLERLGYQVHEARNGREALLEMRCGNAELIVLDLMLPEVSGWDVLDERAEDPELQKIPVIVISANRGDQLARIADQDICAMLPKPFDLEALEAIVANCLAHSDVVASSRGEKNAEVLSS
jgi:CheY-like chemotaxis protein